MVAGWNIADQLTGLLMSTSNQPCIEDSEGVCVSINEATGLIRVSGMPVARAIIKQDGAIILQFLDTDKMRANLRGGTRLIEVPLEVFISKINSCTK